MARILGRSKSLRLLRGGPHKDSQHEEGGHSTPPPVDLDRLKASTPVTRTDSRADTPDILQRPKTAGGQGDHGKLFHKKVAPVTPPHTEFTSRPPYPSSNKSSTTIFYTAEVHEDNEGFIGIALGSPTMNPPWVTSPQTSGELGTVTHISSNAHLPNTTGRKQEAPKQKLSRWKSIFGKKQQSTATQKQSFYQLVQSTAPPRADSHYDDESLESRSISRAEVSTQDLRSQSPPVFKPEIRQSRRFPRGYEQPHIETRPRALTDTANHANTSKPSLMRSASSPKPHMRGDWSQAPAVPQVTISRAPQGMTQAPDTSGPLLNVDIPSIKLDRYSVMFGSVLQSNLGSSSNRSSSLLVRRQGNSERLKPLNELSVKREDEGSQTLKPQRRATSPSHPKSPSMVLSLFPQTTSNKPSSPRAPSSRRSRRLQRSNTAPASSPSLQKFPSQLPEPREEVTAPPVQEAHEKALEEEGNDPNLKSQLFTPTPSSRHSFDSDADDASIIMANSPGAPWRPRMGEPQWELVSKPTQATALRSHPTTVAPEQGPSSAPGDLSNIGKAPTHKLESTPRSADRILSPTPQTQNASQTATIGIARSVSVSRASPRSADLVSPQLIRSATVRALSPASGRFIDQKPLTPTLVELKNRKSQRVQLVDA
ncbi:uncharacterized protein EI97DRAFT_454722 [Westerdykella ornata]|uniref:Uncharacterized protein n=1 Tax=Westerdykella ornata TaxID=318751 RepID=A0A6A6JZA9_WESOR|nr:uncharacterized protein EI97DRAFT_454722 [Westerdykella ornata]KAF2281545.1 hypothetical protein EI97DRAFT_454722 [Westerdykella ornata]